MHLSHVLKVVEIRGIGEAYFETGCEGQIWCVLKDTKEDDVSWSYDNLVLVEENDHLIIYDKIDLNKKVWEGDIHYESTSHQQTNEFGFTGQAIFNMWVHGLQVTADPETWVTYFFKHYPMTLQKKK